MNCERSGPAFDEKKLFDVIARAYLAAIMPRLPLPADKRNA
jgi:hypothetical protein